MKKLCFSLAFLSLIALEAKAQAFRGNTSQIDPCHLLQGLEVTANLNYQILPQTLLPLDPEPRMVIPCGDYTHERVMPLTGLLLPNSLLPRYLLPGINPFNNKIEFHSFNTLHISDFYLLDQIFK